MTQALNRKIFVGCRSLSLDADARRALQLAETGKSSLSDMTDADKLKVIARLEKDGFKPSSKGRFKHKKAPRADLRLVHVLWKKLGDAGALKRPGRDGLNAFIRSRFGKAWGSVPADVDMLRDGLQIDDVVRALKDWGERVGIDFDWEDHTK